MVKRGTSGEEDCLHFTLILNHNTVTIETIQTSGTEHRKTRYANLVVDVVAVM